MHWLDILEFYVKLTGTMINLKMEPKWHSDKTLLLKFMQKPASLEVGKKNSNTKTKDILNTYLERLWLILENKGGGFFKGGQFF